MRAALTPGGVSMAGVQRKLEQEKYEARHTPRMIFAMDATASREPTWEMAGKLHREMGAALGNLTLQLVFFRGDECRASRWVTGGQRLAELMNKVRCSTGYTQIGRTLRHVIDAAGSHAIRALVYVGDCCEEDGEELFALAEQLKRQRIPIFLFHDGRDSVAAPIFRRLAKISEGIYASFDAGSAEQLRKLLTGAAEYAAGKHQSIDALRNTLLLGRK
ncbi:MAG: VWA domain-containing protein [Xanthobacteraceae bacterium]